MPVAARDGEAHIQNFFVRELAEVYLLLDNVSASSTKALSSPKLVIPAEKLSDEKRAEAAKLVAPGSDPAIALWIKTICDVGWPPPKQEGVEAQQAATLILA